MQPIDRNEVLAIGPYEQIREQYRARVIALKQRRRVALGANMTALFENRDTVLYQIQEMLRTERITAEKAILHEMETYNQLIPAADELSATIFIEYPDANERDRMLVELAGIENAFYLEIDGKRLAVRNETGATRTDRTTAVHYVKFPLAAASAAAWRNGTPTVVLGVQHPAYQAATPLAAETLAELAEDLR